MKKCYGSLRLRPGSELVGRVKVNNLTAEAITKDEGTEEEVVSVTVETCLSPIKPTSSTDQPSAQTVFDGSQI